MPKQPANGQQQRRRRSRRGATAVEMAFALPVLLLFTFGIFQTGYAFCVQHLIENAAREGCLLAVAPFATNDEVQGVVDNSLSALSLKDATTSILVNNTPGNIAQAKSGDLVTITVSVPASRVAIVPVSYFSKELTATCVRRHE